MTGVAVYLGAVVGATTLLLRRSARSGVLLPVTVGLVLRAVVMVVVHVVSVGDGEHGFLYLDDINYTDVGRHLAAHWSALNFVNPVGFAYAGSYEAGFPTLVGAVFTLVGGEFLLAAEAVNVLLSAATVLTGALVVAAVFGPHPQRRAAWFLALAPGLIWWSAPLLKEALVGFLVMAGTLTILRARSAPALLLSGVVIAATLFSRATAALAMVVAATATMIGVLIHLRGEANPRRVAALFLPVGTLVLGGLAISHGHVGFAARSVEHTARAMFRIYQGGDPRTLPVDVMKSWVSPYPWIFTAATHTWDRSLYPDMWVLYAAAPTLIYGLWRLRRSPEGWFVILTILVFSVANSAAAGLVFRQRSSAEGLLVVPLIAGLRVPRLAARLGAAAVALVALPAGVHERSIIVALTILGGAGLIAIGSGFLPEDVLEGSDPIRSAWNDAFLVPSASPPTPSGEGASA